MLSNRAVIAVAHQYIIGERELRRESTWMQILPLFIAYGVTCSLMIPLVVGMTLIVRLPMTETISQLCVKFRPNHIISIPSNWEIFADANEKIDLSHLIAPITGGDVLYAAVETKINEYLQRQGSPYLIMNGYGMTEVGAAVACNYQYAHKFGSVGIPFVKSVIAAFDLETGKELKYGQEGEICIQTSSMMLGYVNNQEETDNIIRMREDGLLWVHTGDLGYVSDEGFVHISGRLKRYMVYTVAGVCKKVFSLDVERELLRCPKVEKCAVVPVMNESTYQVPAAFVIGKSGSLSQQDIEEIKEYADKNLDGSHKPVKYIPMEKFPLTRIGKIDYITLEKMANEG